MKRFSLLLLLICCSLSLPALPLRQTVADDGDALEVSLKRFFTNFTLPGFKPKLTIALDDYELDDDLHTLNVYGNEGFSSQLFTPDINRAIYDQLRKALPEPYNTYKLRLYAFGLEIDSLIPNLLQGNKNPERLWGNLDYSGTPWCENISSPVHPTQGLQNRHFVVWASHGRYFSSKTASWIWQRPALFCSTEDLLTQSFVIPYLIPMLENSGAVVYTPRERDWQPREWIVDNDKSDKTDYVEQNGKEQWKKSPKNGFALPDTSFLTNENPFLEGSARYATTTTDASTASYCYWIPNFDESGNYAVYVAYQSLACSVSDAVYTVSHGGMETRVRVNQQMGGGTWVYLGTYHFDKGHSRKNCVSLSNVSGQKGVICADAVRFGGGMGNIARGDDFESEQTSGLPRYLEGARYFAQWSGLPDHVFNTKDGYNDYADDINARSNALNYLGGGSVFIPDSQGTHVPFELSVAVHTDAGIASGDGIIGTLAVRTTENDESVDTFRTGISRHASSDLASLLQYTVCNDMSSLLGRTWTRREIFDRNYSETRLPEVPSAIIEMLSHQNFTDMKYGHDPNFKFHISRAIYKAILRFVCNQHGKSCTVQPLPVRGLSACLQPDGKVLLSWLPTEDALEPSARPDGYIIYMRREGEDFDNGTVVRGTTAASISIPPDVMYSFKVCAFNKGGKSLPSEELSAMHASAATKEILVVNGFTRLSGPAVVHEAGRTGFDLDSDIGVPYCQTPEYCGRQLNFDPTATRQEGPDGIGYSSTELQGTMIAGNSFDNVALHGRAIAGDKRFSFSSCSMEAFLNGTVSTERYKVIDLIFGLQKDCGESSIIAYKTFTPQLRRLIENYLKQGGNLLVSGSYLTSDLKKDEERDFASRVLHYAPSDNTGLPSDSLIKGNSLDFSIIRSLGQHRYAVTHPERLAPVGKAFPCFTYSDGSCAGIAYADNNSTIMALGFPFESIREDDNRSKLMSAFLNLLPQ